MKYHEIKNANEDSDASLVRKHMTKKKASEDGDVSLVLYVSSI